MFRGFRGNAGSSVGGASATLRYERSHSVSAVTNDVLSELEGGKIVFDVYLQQDGGAGAEAEAASAAAAAAALGRRRRMAREIEPPSLVTGRNQVFGSGGLAAIKRFGPTSWKTNPGFDAIEEGDESDGESGESVLSSGDDEGVPRGVPSPTTTRSNSQGCPSTETTANTPTGVPFTLRRGPVLRVVRRRGGCVRRRGRAQGREQGHHQRRVPAYVP